MTGDQIPKEVAGTADWSKEWSNQVSIYQQGRSYRSRELLAYRTLFTALTTIFLGAAFAVGWEHWWGGLFGIVALLLAVLWYLACGRLAEWLDDWDAVLAKLWRVADQTNFPIKERITDIEKHYVAAERMIGPREERKNRCKIWAIIPYPQLRPARLVFNVLIPLLGVLPLSVWVVVHCFSLGIN